MKRKCVQRSRVDRNDGVPSDLARLRNQIQACGCQRRYMQRLANVANSFGTAGVLVDKGPAGSEIQKRDEAKYG